MSIRVVQKSGLVFVNIMVSSEESKWFTFGPYLEILIPGNVPFSCADLQRLEKTSAQMMKM